MTTDFNKILERDDYKRLTENLKSVTNEIAERIRKKMIQLEIDDDNDFDNGEIGVEGVTVKAMSVKSNSGLIHEFLAIKRIGDSCGEYDWRSLQDIGDEYYFASDFNAVVNGASNKEALDFLNVAPKLIQGLGEIEQKKVDAIKSAIDNAHIM